MNARREAAAGAAGTGGKVAPKAEPATAGGNRALPIILPARRGNVNPQTIAGARFTCICRAWYNIIVISLLENLAWQP